MDRIWTSSPIGKRQFAIGVFNVRIETLSKDDMVLEAFNDKVTGNKIIFQLDEDTEGYQQVVIQGTISYKLLCLQTRRKLGNQEQAWQFLDKHRLPR